MKSKVFDLMFTFISTSDNSISLNVLHVFYLMVQVIGIILQCILKASMAKSHFFGVTGSSCMTKVHVSTLFQKTSSLLHYMYVMEQSVKK